jgi:hypothetical protein
VEEPVKVGFTRDVMIPVLIALLLSVLGTGGLWIIGAYAWLLFMLPALLLGWLAIWLLRTRTRQSTRLRLVLTLSACWAVAGVTALLINIGLAVVQQGTYDPVGLGRFWFVWVLGPVAAIITTVVRAALAARSNS